MSTDEYVPSDDQVRGRYCDGTYVQTGHTTEGEDFDAWLARVRRDAAREALGALDQRLDPLGEYQDAEGIWTAQGEIKLMLLFNYPEENR